MVVGIFCNCGGLHKTVEEWKECPMSTKAKQIEQDWYGVTGDDPAPSYLSSRSVEIALNAALIFFIFPLMFVLLGMAYVADYISRRRLRKRTNAAIQEPAKRRPRRAF